MTARPEVTVVTRFLPKPTDMLTLEGFSLGAFVSAALAEQPERDHQVPLTAVGKSPRRPGWCKARCGIAALTKWPRVKCLSGKTLLRGALCCLKITTAPLSKPHPSGELQYLSTFGC